MPTEVIAIGDEMTSGARVDTNSAWLSRRLGELGHEVTRHSTIADEIEPMVEEFQAAMIRSDIVVVTGGLGPTRDDLTREAIATAAGRELVLHRPSLDHIEAMFSRRSMPMPERNVAQAMLPVGAEPIDNPGGTAPGVDLQHGRCRLFALPGVPAEMKPMFDGHIAAALLGNRGGGQVIRHRVMKFFGIGESDMESRLGDMIARGRRPRIGITVSGATISLRITALATTEFECQRLIDAAVDDILDRVGELHFGDGERIEQHDVVERMLSDSGQRMITIELGGGCPLADWFASHGPSRQVIADLAFADQKTLIAMAGTSTVESAMERLASNLDADLALAVDPYPDFAAHDSVSRPATNATLILHRRGRPTVRRVVTIGGHPSIIRPRIAKTALAWLREQLGKA